MIGTSLRQALSIRGKLLGTYIQYPAASVIEVLKLAGVDYVVLDLEHGQNSFHNIIEMVYASEACGMIPVVRVPGLDEAIIGRVLDLGVSAIKIPGVHSGKDAKNAVAYCKYPPIGVRGGCPGVRGNRYGTDPDCWQRSNEDIMICCLVESKDAVDNMEDIISTPGIDVVNVGVGDLSRSLCISKDDSYIQEARIKCLSLCEKYHKYTFVGIEGAKMESPAARLINLARPEKILYQEYFKMCISTK